MEVIHNCDFGKLPVEVIENIFTYLPIFDVKTASLLCHQWFKASLCPEIVAKTKLVIHNTFSVNDYSIFMKGSLRKYTSLQFKSVIFDDSITENKDVWKQLGKTITDIHFKWCRINDKSLFIILDNFPNLSALNLNVEVHHELDSNQILPKYVNKLKSLTIKSTFPFNEDTLLEICNKTPTIENFIFETTVYPETYTMIPTFQVIEKLSVSLKSLSVYFHRETEDLLICLPQMENLHLESLVCHMYDDIEESVFSKFVHKLSSLVNLDISPCVLEDSSFIEICTYMPNLKSLRLSECDTVTNEAIVEVTRLKKLEKLVITQCQNISNEGIINGIAKNRNDVMKYIYLSGYFSDDSLIGIAQNLPNLRYLEINTILFLSKGCVRTIFEHLRWLRSLLLDSLNSESDYDMFVEHEVIQKLIPSDSEEFRINSIKGLRELSLSGFDDVPGASIEDISDLTELESLTISYNCDLNEILIKDLLKKCKCLKKSQYPI